MEFALVLPVFALLVMGAIDYGYFFFSEQVVTNAAREAARAGTLTDPGGQPPTSAAQAAAVDAAAAAGRNYLANNGLGCPSDQSACVRAAYTTASGLPAIDVQIQYSARSLTGFGGVVLPAHVQAHAVMRWQ